MSEQTSTEPKLKPLLVDSHLDVAANAYYNDRDLTLTLPEIRAAERSDRTAMTSLPAFGEASVAVVCASLFVMPASPKSLGNTDVSLPRPMRYYATPEEAEAQALEQLRTYEEWAEDGRIRILRNQEDLDIHLRRFRDDGVVGFVIMIEGADPIRDPDALPAWFERGVRMISLAWESTRYAGGTGGSTGLTDFGRELLAGMAELGIIHDAVHLSEEAFWEALSMPSRGVCVSHGSARALMLPPPGYQTSLPLNRFLSDEQIAVVARPHGAASRGVIGLALLNNFLDPRWGFSPQGRETRVTMGEQGAAQLRHLGEIAGWESIGIGSDTDIAVYGREETPAELDSVLDWSRIGDFVPADARDGVLGGNWLRFLGETLPEDS
jgi:membrane dipeptidase